LAAHEPEITPVECWPILIRVGLPRFPQAAQLQDSRVSLQHQPYETLLPGGSRHANDVCNDHIPWRRAVQEESFHDVLVAS
jgi:hypothetical protein